MPIWEQFPYSNTHELNLDWIISKVKDLDKFVSEIVGQNLAGTIIFANPIQWDINNDYGRYNLVLDSNYSAYLSIKDVPAGTLLSDTVYWEPVGNFAGILELVLNNFAYNQLNDPIAAKTYAIGDLLVYNEELYQVTSVINMGYTIDPGTNCTQVTIEDLYKPIKTDLTTATNNITTINSNIGTINSTLSTLHPQERIKNHFRFYIDGVSGSDDNDGLSASSAFKTLDKFLSMSDRYTEIRGYIMSAGTYVVTLGYNVACVNIHINAQVAGVTIQLPTDVSNEFSFYSTHINLKGLDSSNHMTVIAPPSSGLVYGKIYADNTAWNMQYVDMPYNQFSLYGSNGEIRDCSLKGVAVTNGYVILHAIKILNDDPDFTPVALTNAKCAISGTWSTTDLTATGTVPYLLGTAAYIFVGSVILSNTTNKYTYALSLNYSYLNITTSRLNSLAGRAQSGNSVGTAQNNEVYNPA